MFDPSAPHIIILLVVVLLLFGSSRLPGAAKSLGSAMHMFKRSVQGMDEDGKDGSKNAQASVLTPPALPQPAPAQPLAAQDPAQQQLQDLQRQVADLQRQKAAEAAAPNGAAAETRHDQQAI